MAVNTPDPNAGTPPADPNWIDTIDPHAKKAILELRQENASWRVKNKELAAQVAAGNDPAIVAENRDLKIKLALGNKTRELGIRYDLAHSLLTTNGSLAKLDPAADDFVETIGDLVTALAEKEPALKTSQTPARGGSPHIGPGPGDGGGNQLTMTELVAMQNKPDEVAAALASGRLNNILRRR